MKLTGKWCQHCGRQWGINGTKVPLQEYEHGVCDGCGEEAYVVPAFKFKITVAKARQAINERRKANEQEIERPVPETQIH